MSPVEPDTRGAVETRAWLARRWAGVRAAAFPGALLLFATFFLGGRIGFWSDDYWHNLRGPGGELPVLTFSGMTMDRGFFLRPLFYWAVPAVTTLSWKTQWPAHLLLTATHGLVVLLLWRLMRTLGLSARGAVAAALLFMVYPGSFEALFWTAALPTPVATALMLRLMTVYAQHARREKAFAGAGARGWLSLAAMPALAFEVCCFNEQPAMGVLALPLVYWAARRSDPSPWPGSGAREWARALAPAAGCGLAVLAYAALVVLEPNKPPGARGSAEQFVTLHELPARAAYFGNVLWRRLVLLNFGPGAWKLGWRIIAGEGWSGWARLGVAALAGVLWVRRWVRGRVGVRATDGPGGLGGIAWLGAVVFVTGWLPILMMRVYDPDSRTRYWPAVGLALIAGAVFTALERWIRARGSGTALACLGNATGAGLVAILLSLAVMLVGVQGAFRWRWELDRRQGWELRGQLPDPAPYTFFVPLSVANTGVWTGSVVLDGHFRSAWEFPWTAPKFLRSAYGRADLHCGYWRHWTPRRPVIGADERGILYADALGPRFPREGPGSRVPWAMAAPFVVNGDGRAVLVTRVVIAGPDGRETVVEVPQAATAGGWARRPAVTVRLPRS
jgi:hypothetical protein